MTPEDRRLALSAYKERKPQIGIFSVKCRVTGEMWVGHTPNLGTIANRIWFTLKMGTHPNRSLQQSWNDYGMEEMEFAMREQLEIDDLGYSRASSLKERALVWRLQLNAQPL